MSLNLETAMRRLPKVGDVLESETGKALLAQAPRWAVVDAIREEIARMREAIRAGEAATLDATRLARALHDKVRPSLSRVVNATGVVLHTNLGRAPLAQAAIDRVVEVARGYSNLEYRLDEKQRGSRHAHVTSLLRELTGAEDALVVNNCAAAVLVALGALAQGGRVIVSRGELVEIGGGFRVPEVMTASGATLVEVGTTNRTRAADYARVLEQHDDVRLLMKVHRSNFSIVGFTEETSVRELAALGTVFVDLGSGALSTLPGANEPTVRAQIEAGAHLVAFSGDKLLGGPQAGILVGKTTLIERIAKHPLLRALRPDKLTIAALEATLALHRADRTSEIPSLAMLQASDPQLKARADELVRLLEAACPRGRYEAVRVRSAIGGGSSPGEGPWSWAVAAELPDTREDALEARLRSAAIVARIADGRLLLDVRTLLDGDLADVASAFASWGT